MTILIFAVGLIAGMLMRDIKPRVVDEVAEIKKWFEEIKVKRDVVQFIEHTNPKEIFENTEKIDDFVKQLHG